MIRYEGSLWSGTHSCFEQGTAVVERYLNGYPYSVLILGCGDGKHTIPLLRNGHRVVALDDDPVAIYGGSVDYEGEPVNMKGLVKNIEDEGIDTRLCEIILSDYMAYETPRRFDLVLTSCSWEFSRNRGHAIGEILAKICSFVRPGGFLLADYFLPHDPKHFALEHYLTRDRLAAFLAEPEWRIMFNEDYGVISELHIQRKGRHQHRYGGLLALRVSQHAAVG